MVDLGGRARCRSIAAGQVVRAARGDVEWHQTVWQLLGEAAFTAAAGAIGTTCAPAARRETTGSSARPTEEQLRMAQDLHDGVGHGLAVIAMQAGVALHVLDQEPAKARASLEAIRDQSREALDELRSELARMSGQPAPRRSLPGVDGIAALVDRVRAGGLEVDLTVDPGDLPTAVDHAAYVVVQESLTNVLRHARATRAIVTLERPGTGSSSPSPTTGMARLAPGRMGAWASRACARASRHSAARSRPAARPRASGSGPTLPVEAP